MKEKILTMLKLQDAMNRKVNSEWRTENFPWYRAIWTECAEMLDHYGWKWWKHQEPDMQQVRLEVVDIWHFTLSAYLMHEEDQEQTAERILVQLQQSHRSDSIRTAIEDLAHTVIQTKDADAARFASIMQHVDMTFDDLYRTYIGKNVLNFFRQDHGYQEGHYQKTWDGREDNEHLADILASLNPDSPTFSDEVYAQLTAAYPGQTQPAKRGGYHES